MKDVVVAVLGLGEAGSLIAGGLLRAGAIVRGYDPRVPQAGAVVSLSTAAQACQGADLVLSVNSAADALDALAQGLPGCSPGTIWADLNTAAPAVKRAIEEAAGERLRVVDVALMAPVPPRGLQTPMSVSGAAAGAFAGTLKNFGANIEIIDDQVGSAATHKLLRSVFYKGLAAAVVEALEAARAVGLQEWLSANIAEELTRADASTLQRLVTGSRTHAARRVHEMQAATELLESLGVPARVSRASRDWLQDLSGD